MKNCPKCGALIGDAVALCAACGGAPAPPAPRPEGAAPEEPRGTFAGELRSAVEKTLPVYIALFSFLTGHVLAFLAHGSRFKALSVFFFFGVPLATWAAGWRFPAPWGKSLRSLAGWTLGWTVFSSIYIPSYAGLIRYSYEGATRGNLGAIRMALSSAGKLPQPMPEAKTPPYHRASDKVLYGNSADDRGGWVYDNAPGGPGFGAVFVNCTHTDHQGKSWTEY